MHLRWLCGLLEQYAFVLALRGRDGDRGVSSILMLLALGIVFDVSM